MQVKYRLVEDPERGRVTLRIINVESPAMQSDLISFYSSGRVQRHYAVDPSFGLSLTDGGRLRIHE